MKLRTGLLAAVVGVVALAAQAAPNDPHYAMQWGLDRVRAPEAWSVSKGEGIVVAIVDSGIDLGHPDLSGAIARDDGGKVVGRDFVDDDDDPADEHGHGTMVAGIVAARTANGIGVASMAPLARLMPIRVLDAEAAGTSADVDAGIRWAVDHGAHVVNLSLEVARQEAEGPTPSLIGSEAPDEAVRYAWQRGVVVVAAAGNDSSAFTDYDASTPVFLVGASDRDDGRASFSDTGREDAVVAPGVEIVSTWCDPCGSKAEHTYGQSEGTSYAAPHVAGAVALLLASGLGPDEAVERLRETAVDIGPPGPDGDTGHGRIDAAAALGVASESPSPTPSPTPSSPSRSPTRSSPPQHGAGGEPARPPFTPEPSPEPERTRPTETATPVPPTTSPPTDPTHVAGGAEPPSQPIAPWALLAAALLAVDVVALVRMWRHDRDARAG